MVSLLRREDKVDSPNGPTRRSILIIFLRVRIPNGEIYCLALVFRLCFFNGHGGLMVDLKAAFPRFREHWARLLGIDGNIQRGGINTAYHRAGHSLFVENGW